MQCSGCAHWRGFDGGNSMRACHFAVDMWDAGNIGVVRGIPARECYKNKVHFKPVAEAKENATQNVDNTQ